MEYDRALKMGDYQRRKELELLCDAIGIVILHQLGMNTSRLMAGVENISRFNIERFGMALNENAYPTVSWRRQFARAVGEWAAGADWDGSGGERCTGPGATLSGAGIRVYFLRGPIYFPPGSPPRGQGGEGVPSAGVRGSAHSSPVFLGCSWILSIYS